MPARIQPCSGLLAWILVAVLALALGCGAEPHGSGDAKAPRPSAAQIAGAVLKSLLSNSVETREAAAPADEAAASPALESDPTDARLAVDSAAETCLIPYDGTVTIIPVRSSGSIQKAVAERRQVPVVYATDDTAIWEDGRVLTTDMENVGRHLNAVGWAANPMEIAGTGQRPGASRQNLGFGSAISSFERGGGSDTKKLKRTRRRG